jgi:A/G-specific adenine glycosylase
MGSLMALGRDPRWKTRPAINDVVPSSDRMQITQPLLRWFRKTKRNLPWRHTYNPYHVWISEIMLQQTQMDRGVRYFLRWIDRFPDVASVAAAEQQEILKYWEGLGYYARARNLHKAAKVMACDFGGQVPCEHGLLLSLPGIGPYTAAAIASIAGNYDIPVIDANVSRVYARLFDVAHPVREGPGQKLIAAIAEKLLPQGQARAYNQALMDLGGMICTPRNPLCGECPVASACRSLQAGTIGVRPVAQRKPDVVVMHAVAALIRNQGRIYIQQRSANEVWGGLWEFPGGQVAEGEAAAQLADRISEQTGLAVAIIRPIARIAHQYTNHKILLHCFLCQLVGEKRTPVLRSACDYRWIHADELDQFAFPAGPRKLLEHIRASGSALLYCQP